MKMAEWAVKKRRLLFWLTVVAAIVCAVLMLRLNVSSDMTVYLPDSSPMKQGLDILKEELGTSISFSSPVSSELPLWIVIAAVILVIAILVIASTSFLEPFLYLGTIGMAILINMGTTFFYHGGRLSDVTYSIAALLQLVLSLDYSVILSNRFRQELASARSADAESRCDHSETRVTGSEKDRESGADASSDSSAQAAMARAIHAAAPSVFGSGLTTVVGLLTLSFMSFKIGAELGFVLAKGALTSMICIFTALPALLLFFHRGIGKTAKRPITLPTEKLASFSVRFRFPILVFFLVLAAAVFVLKDGTRIAYTLDNSRNPDASAASKQNVIIALYSNKDSDAMASLLNSLDGDQEIKAALAWENTLGLRGTRSELLDAIPALVDRLYSADGLLSMAEANMGELADAGLADQKGASASGENIKEPGTEQGTESGNALRDSASRPAGEDSASHPAEGAGSALESLPDKETVMGYLDDYIPILRALPAASSDEELTLDEYIRELVSTVSKNPLIGAFLGDEEKQVLTEIPACLDMAGSALRMKEHSLLFIDAGYPKESDATFAFFDRVQQVFDESFSEKAYLIGESPMAWEMSTTFGAEMNRMTIITAASVFAVVLLVYRTFAVPLLLVFLIQTSVYITMVIIRLQGSSIYYLAFLMVQSILMGATIDYAIVYSGYYREERKRSDILESVAGSYRKSINTILTSSLIIIVATFVLGYAFPNPTVGQICHTIAKGAASSLAMVLFVLPGTEAALDRFIKK